MDRTDWDLIDARNRAAFRPSRTRAKVAMALLGVTTAIIVLEVVVMARGFSFVERFGNVTLAELSLWQRDLNRISGIYLLALVPTAIAYLAWQSRVVDNIPALSGSEAWVSPRWSIALWFIPLANFVASYRILADAWSRLADREEERRRTAVRWWWLLWFGGSIGTNILLAVSKPDTPAGLNGFLTGFAAGTVANALAGIVLIWIIREMERRIRVRVARNAAVSTPAAVPAPTSADAALAGAGD